VRLWEGRLKKEKAGKEEETYTLHMTELGPKY
jgi:hypothetical protein